MKKYYIRIRTIEQLEAVMDWGRAEAVLADPGILEQAGWPDAFSGGENDPDVYFCLPDVTRQAKIRLTQSMVEMAGDRAGLVIYGPDQLGMLLETGFTGPVIADAMLYACNSESFKLYLELSPSLRFISNDELTDRELSETGYDVIYKAYGHQQLMVTNQCLIKNHTGCGRKIL